MDTDNKTVGPYQLLIFDEIVPFGHSDMVNLLKRSGTPHMCNEKCSEMKQDELDKYRGERGFKKNKVSYRTQLSRVGRRKRNKRERQNKKVKR